MAFTQKEFKKTRGGFCKLLVFYRGALNVRKTASGRANLLRQITAWFIQHYQTCQKFTF